MKKRITVQSASAWLLGFTTIVAIACNSSTTVPNPTSSSSASNSNSWLTNHRDNARTGWNSNETILTPTNVAHTTFGKRFSLPTDGYAYAQPLYVPGVAIPGQGTHNVVYIATEADSVYAYDADGSSATPLWHVNFTDGAQGITNLGEGDTQCTDIGPQIGITGTPVIDPSTGTMYVVAVTKMTFSDGYIEYHQNLHALDITTGNERPNSPTEIIANDFDPLRFNQRGSITLVGQKIYIGWASNCDMGPYNGMIISYDKTSLAQDSVFRAAQAGNQAGIWTTQTGMSADSSGNIYAGTGNGVFDGTENFGSAVLKISDSSTYGLQLSDYFTPFDQAVLNNQTNDLDVGSGGILILPDQTGATPHLMVTAGKSGQVYLLNRDNLGQYDPSDTSFSRIVQSFNLSGVGYSTDGTDAAPTNGGNFGAPAYFNGKVYFVPVSRTSTMGIQAYELSNGKFVSGTCATASPTPAPSSGSATQPPAICPVDQTPASVPSFGWPGGTPVVSSNGTTNGIVWFIDTHHANDGGAANNFPGNPAILYAFDANNLAAGPLFSGSTTGIAVKHVSPTVINGKVYVATRTDVEIFGL